MATFQQWPPTDIFLVDNNKEALAFVTGDVWLEPYTLLPIPPRNKALIQLGWVDRPTSGFKGRRSFALPTEPTAMLPHPPPHMICLWLQRIAQTHQGRGKQQFGHNIEFLLIQLVEAEWIRGKHLWMICRRRLRIGGTQGAR